MRIGTKFAIFMACAAVLPLAAASAVFLRTSGNVGQEIAREGARVLSERVTSDMRRALEQGAIALSERRENALQTTRLFASEIAARLSAQATEETPPPPSEAEFLLSALPHTGGTTTIDLERVEVVLADDAERDHLAGTLSKLSGLVELMRPMYLRNRSTVRHFLIALDDGISLIYPAGSVPDLNDPRERTLYLSSIERNAPLWSGPNGTEQQSLTASAPIQYADGRFAGVVSVDYRLDEILNRALDPGHLPGETAAYALQMRTDDPQLLPYALGHIRAGETSWRLEKNILPVMLDGDDQWLKVVSDMRSKVPGLETVVREGKKEVWAFGPTEGTETGAFALAVVSPAEIFDEIDSVAGNFVDQAFNDQLRYAIGFAVAVAILAAMAGIGAARSMTRPVREMHNAAKALIKGDFTVRIAASGRDELGQLASGFNLMVPALEARLKQQKDLDIAREIQQHLVPKAAPNIAGFDVAGLTRYSDETGGDYLDYIDLDKGGVAAVIGDATGHGVGAALLMATARSALRTNTQSLNAAKAVVGATNRQLAADSAGGRFVTMLYVVLGPDNDDIQWISAGQEPALVFDPEADTFERLEGEGIPLGVDAEWTYEAKTTTLKAGQIFVAVTDGVREAKRADGTTFGGERLRDAIRKGAGRGSQAISDLILEDVTAFMDDTGFGDDLTILVVQRTK